MNLKLRDEKTDSEVVLWLERSDEGTIYLRAGGRNTIGVILLEFFPDGSCLTHSGVPRELGFMLNSSNNSLSVDH